MSIIYLNKRGQSIEIGNSFPFVLSSIDGTGSPEVSIQTARAPYQDGSTVNDVLINERVISINGTIIGDSMQDLFAKRQYFCSVLNPKLKEGKLKYINDNGEKIINCYPEQVAFGEKYGTAQDFLITLFCPNPYWVDEFETGEQITTWIGGWKLPFKLPFKFKTKGETKKNIYNSGHVETPVEVIFKGPAVNPSIINHTTGEFIKVNRTLTSDDALIISTAFGNKKVEIERNGVTTNAFNYIDLDSTFFSLLVGDNLMEYKTDGLDPESVEIRYKNRYLGI